MGDAILNDQNAEQKPFSFCLLDLRDQLQLDLRQAAALIVVANSNEFLENSDTLIVDYLAVLQNLIINAYENYQRLDKLLTS